MGVRLKGNNYKLRSSCSKTSADFTVKCCPLVGGGVIASDTCNQRGNTCCPTRAYIHNREAELSHHLSHTHTGLVGGGFSHRFRFPLCLRLHLLRITCAHVSHRKDFSWTTQPGKAHCTVSGEVNVYTALRLKDRPCRSNSSLQQEQFLSSGRLTRRGPPRWTA